VIASGGFEGNPEMMTRYIGPTARYLRPVARGGYYNRGEGIRLALELGAAPAGDFSSFHAEPLDPRSPAPEALVMNFPYGLLVNRQGRRFTDEAPGPVDVHYDHIARAIKDEPDGIAWVVFDQRIHDVPNWKRSIRTDQPPIQADSIAALAQACGISVAGLERTVQAYNAACGAGEFSPLRPDGLAAQGLEPPKSHWARPIDQSPYLAYPIMAGICFTYGGIKTDSQARVVDADGRPVPGLYAAGEATGLYYQVYTGATSVLRGAVFGKIAGEQAAASFG
jgi:tricarballylate dehydrogenase